VKSGDLVKYSWGGSRRMGLVLDFQPAMMLPPRQRHDRVLIQWMPGNGPLPRMYDEKNDVIGSMAVRRMGDNAMGWHPIKNSYGWDIFDRVNS